jgi:hypothetical protein
LPLQKDVGENEEKKELSYMIGGHVNYTTIVENGMEDPQKTRNRSSIGFSNPISEYISKRNEISLAKRYLHTHVFVALFTIAKIWTHVRYVII